MSAVRSHTATTTPARISEIRAGVAQYAVSAPHAAPITGAAAAATRNSAVVERSSEARRKRRATHTRPSIETGHSQ